LTEEEHEAKRMKELDDEIDNMDADGEVKLTE